MKLKCWSNCFCAYLVVFFGSTLVLNMSKVTSRPFINVWMQSVCFAVAIFYFVVSYYVTLLVNSHQYLMLLVTYAYIDLYCLFTIRHQFIAWMQQRLWQQR